MFNPKWYNTELSVISAEIFKDFLRDHSIRFESSGCFNLIHFEIFVPSEKIFNLINDFLLFLPE